MVFNIYYKNVIKIVIFLNILNDNIVVIVWMVWDIYEEVELDLEFFGIFVDSFDGVSVGCGSGNVKKFIVFVEFFLDGV